MMVIIGVGWLLNYLGLLLLFYYFGTTQVINMNIKSNTADYWFTWFFWVICACVGHYIDMWLHFPFACCSTQVPKEMVLKCFTKFASRHAIITSSKLIHEHTHMYVSHLKASLFQFMQYQNLTCLYILLCLTWNI